MDTERERLVARIIDAERTLRRRTVESRMSPLLDLNLTMQQTKVLLLLAFEGCEPSAAGPATATGPASTSGPASATGPASGAGPAGSATVSGAAAARGGMPGQELARHLGVGLAATTGIVDRLVGQGLVTRTEDPDDRRVRRIELTADGAALVGRLRDAGLERMRRLLDRLDDATLADLERVLLALATAAEDDPAGR
jgi:DNA-binding MarR family transcriptional regulator